LPVQQEHHKNNVSRQWKLLKRTLMSERSPWGKGFDYYLHAVIVVVVVVVVVVAVCCFCC